MTLLQLWLPILATAVAVFVASSLIHMVFKWHNSEYRALPNEDEVRRALGNSDLTPGMYATPHCTDMKDMEGDAIQQQFREGPVAFITMRAPGAPEMGKYLAQWFLSNIAIAALCAFVAAQNFAAHHDAHQAGHMAGIVAMIAYGTGTIHESIWMGRPWSATMKNLLDALIYGVATALVFWQLWPAMV
ncbi:MAG: hypothetical protein HY253_08055 [Burkholderiales bacterium]|nr:hypothetical protein [Burkholderiales bacterium]